MPVARSLYNTKHPVKSIRGHQGVEVPSDRKSIFHRHDECAWRQRRGDGLRPVFSALQTGVIDGAENNPPSYVFSNHYTAAKYFSLTEHLIYSRSAGVLQKRPGSAFSRRSRSDQETRAREAQLEERDLWNKYEQQADGQGEGSGCQMSKSPTRRVPERVKPVWEQIGRNIRT